MSHHNLILHTGGIAMSRALGDLECKKPAPDGESNKIKNPSHPRSSILDTDLTKATGIANGKHHGMQADWISNTPHINYHSLTENHRSILMLASDGLGEEKDCKSSLLWAARKMGGGESAQKVASRLAEKSSTRTGDNSTVMIACFE